MGTDWALMKIIQKRKLTYFGHIVRAQNLCKKFFGTSKTIVNDIRQWTAKRHPGCTTTICHNKMERAGSLMSIFIVADPGRSTAIPVKPFLTKNSFFHPFRVNPDLNNFCALSYNARVLVGSACSRCSVGKTNCHGETAQ